MMRGWESIGGTEEISVFVMWGLRRASEGGR